MHRQGEEMRASAQVDPKQTCSAPHDPAGMCSCDLHAWRTSMRGPMVAASASWELTPKVPTAMAIACSARLISCMSHMHGSRALAAVQFEFYAARIAYAPGDKMQWKMQARPARGAAARTSSKLLEDAVKLCMPKINARWCFQMSHR